MSFHYKTKNSQIIVILSLLQKAKNPQNLRHALNLWILRFAQYDTKSVWYDKKGQYDKNYDTKSVWYDKFRLSPKFFETKEKFKEFKEFANFLKNFY